MFSDIVDQTQTTWTGLRGPTSKGKGRQGREEKERRRGQERPPLLQIHGSAPGHGRFEESVRRSPVLDWSLGF